MFFEFVEILILELAQDEKLINRSLFVEVNYLFCFAPFFMLKKNVKSLTENNLDSHILIHQTSVSFALKILIF
jgi:hypothetical protein